VKTRAKIIFYISINSSLNEKCFVGGGEGMQKIKIQLFVSDNFFFLNFVFENRADYEMTCENI